MEEKKQQLHKKHQFGASKISLLVQHCCLFLFFFNIFTTTTTTQAFDYGDALSKSVLYFEAQRSGRLPYNQRVTWRDHSALIDGLEQGVSSNSQEPKIHLHVKYLIHVFSLKGYFNSS